MPEPATPPSEEGDGDRAAAMEPSEVSAALKKVARRRGERALAYPPTPPPIIVERFNMQSAPFSSEASPSTSARSGGSAASGLQSELESSRRRLKLLQLEADKLAGATGEAQRSADTQWCSAAL